MNTNIIKPLNNHLSPENYNFDSLASYYYYHSIIYYEDYHSFKVATNSDTISPITLLYFIEGLMLPEKGNPPISIRLKKDSEEYRAIQCKNIERRLRLRVLDYCYHNISGEEFNTLKTKRIFFYCTVSYLSKLQDSIIPCTELLNPQRVKWHIDMIYQHNSLVINQFYQEYCLKSFTRDYLDSSEFAHLSKKQKKSMKKKTVFTQHDFIVTMFKKSLIPLQPNIDIIENDRYNLIGWMHYVVTTDPNTVLNFVMILEEIYNHQNKDNYLKLKKQVVDYANQVAVYLYFIHHYIKTQPELSSEITDILYDRDDYEAFVFANEPDPKGKYAQGITFALNSDFKFIYISTKFSDNRYVVKTVNRFVAFLVHWEEFYFHKLEKIELIIYANRNKKTNEK